MARPATPEPRIATPHPTVPVAAERVAYVGARRCRDCHEENFERWAKSWHGRALMPATRGNVAGEWNGAHFKGDSSEAWMKRDGSEYQVRTRDREGTLGDYPVSWVIGGKRMQDPLTILPDGRWQVLPVYYHVTGRRWVDYNEAKQGRVTPEHPFFWTNLRRTANYECLDCHVTGLEVRIDDSGTWTTSFADAGVGCESCHGPGGRHAETMEPSDIVQPRKLDADRELALCGQCHGPRDPLFPLLDDQHRFRPGQRYEESYEVYLIASATGRSGDVFADGRPAIGSFEYQALLQSACHRKGKATCLSCHTAPHAEHGRDELAFDRGDGTPIADQGCQPCHQGLFERRAEHSHHRDAAAQSCVACHMPRLIPAVLDLEADHSIDVPVPENTERHRVPNACGLCHEKKTPAALADAIRRWWPGAARRQARRIRLADAFDLEIGERTPAALVAVAGDPDEATSVRAAAVTVLAQVAPGALPRLLRPMLAGEVEALRATAAQAAGLIRARELAPLLLRLRDDQSIRVREASALALTAVGAPEAEAAVRRLVRDPATEGLPEPHIRLAWYLGHRGDFARATAELERALALRPYSVSTMLMLSEAYVRRGRRAEARSVLETALRYEPGNQPARDRLRHLDSARP